MPSHYEINVSHHGHHFFATAPRSCMSEDQARRVFRAIKDRFSADDGYAVTATYYCCAGASVTFE